MFDISMQDMARMMNYSEAYFCKLFKQCFHKNFFTSYLTEFRVAEAKKMLEEPTVNVKEIGKAVGYGDSNYFKRFSNGLQARAPRNTDGYFSKNVKNVLRRRLYNA